MGHISLSLLSQGMVSIGYANHESVGEGHCPWPDTSGSDCHLGQLRKNVCRPVTQGLANFQIASH